MIGNDASCFGIQMNVWLRVVQKIVVNFFFISLISLAKPFVSYSTELKPFIVIFDGDSYKTLIIGKC